MHVVANENPERTKVTLGVFQHPKERITQEPSQIKKASQRHEVPRLVRAQQPSKMKAEPTVAQGRAPTAE